MYRLLFLKEGLHNKVIGYHEFGSYETLEEAKADRKVSGDLVFKGNQIVEDPSWLWDWEKEEPSYARRCIERKVRLS